MVSMRHNPLDRLLLAVPPGRSARWTLAAASGLFSALALVAAGLGR
jgi:hypothetical protein